MDNNAPTDELVRLEKRYWQAVQEQDAKTCADLSHDPCVVTGAQGVGQFSRDEMRAMMEKRPTYTLDAFELKDVKARMLGPDIGIVAYVVSEKLTVEGRPVAFQAADSSTWVRREGRWTCVLHTEAILGDPFGRDKARTA